MALSQVVSNNPHALMTNLNTNPSYESSSANISDGIYIVQIASCLLVLKCILHCFKLLSLPEHCHTHY